MFASADVCQLGCHRILLTVQVTIPTLGEASAEALAPLLGGLPLELRPKMEAFIQGVYAVRTAENASAPTPDPVSVLTRACGQGLARASGQCCVALRTNSR